MENDQTNMEEDKRSIMSFEPCQGTVISTKQLRRLPSTVPVDQPKDTPKAISGKPIRDFWLQSPPKAPRPGGDVFGYTQPDPAKHRGERYTLPDKYKAKRPISPVWGNRQYRYPKQDATMETRFVCVLLNYLQRTELPNNEMAKNTLYQLQCFSRFVQPRDEHVVLHIHLMKANDPQFLGGCQELLEVMRLDNIDGLSALEVSIACTRNCRHDDMLHDYYVVYRVLIYVKLLTENENGETVVMKNDQGQNFIYTIEVDYLWETSFENTEKMIWADVLEAMRNKAKCMYDSFGHIRSREEFDEVKQRLLPAHSSF